MLLVLLLQQLLLMLHLMEVLLLLLMGMQVRVGVRGWGRRMAGMQWRMVLETALVEWGPLHVHVGLLGLLMLWHLQIPTSLFNEDAQGQVFSDGFLARVPWTTCLICDVEQVDFYHKVSKS